MTLNQDYFLVAAIDFGTTYSGYAFSMKDSFKKDPLQIHANQAWNAGGRQLLSLKTPTCLLLNSDKQFEAFGYEAENKYAELVLDGEHIDYYYFHRFKMSLHNNQDVKSDMILEDITGKSVKAMDVFALSIEALKNHLITTLHTQGTGLKPTEIQWVLTVPAIWKDNAKQFMRTSAEKAGIPQNRLYISLEPEAASIYCKYLPIEKFKGSVSGFSMADVGTKYMVIDLGGGTADITVHETVGGDNLKELCMASGGDCGGTSVDAAFIQMLAIIFGLPFISTMQREEPEAYLDLIREFEIVKRTVTSSRAGKINMAIPYVTLDSLCKKHLRNDLPQSLSSSPYAKEISLRGDKMRIDADLFRTLYDKTTQKVIHHMKEVFKRKEAQSVNQLILVGGFSECSIIQEAIKNEFSKYRVVVPQDCGLAVLKGAVLFGHNPNFIASRISRFTYGIAFDDEFDPKIHNEKHLLIRNGEKLCCNAFDVIMKKDVHVPAGTKVKQTYTSKFNKEKIVFRLFFTENSDPLYVDEEGCNLLGKAEVKVSDSSKKQKIEVEIVFGNTELSLMATNTDDDVRCEATFDLI